MTVIHGISRPLDNSADKNLSPHLRENIQLRNYRSNCFSSTGGLHSHTDAPA